MVYLHDGTFEGVLSAIYTMFYAKATFDEGKLEAADAYQQSFFELTLKVPTDRENAHAVAKKLFSQFGEEGFKLIYNAYLCENNHYGTHLFRALKVAFKAKLNTFEALQQPDILAINQMATKVSREAHFFLGLIRFRCLENDIYYADFEPSQNILPIIMYHFEERLSDQLWVIHDKKRGIAAFYDKNTSFLAALDSDLEMVLSQNELDWQKLWSHYVKDIAIEARKNKSLQRQHMPKKYWPFLTEMKVEYSKRQ